MYIFFVIVGLGTSNSNNNAVGLAGSSNSGVFTNAQKPNKFNGGLFGSSGESGEDLNSGEPSPIGGIDGATASNGYLPPEGSAPSDNVPAFSRPPKKGICRFPNRGQHLCIMKRIFITTVFRWTKTTSSTSGQSTNSQTDFRACANRSTGWMCRRPSLRRGTFLYSWRSHQSAASRIDQCTDRKTSSS